MSLIDQIKTDREAGTPGPWDWYGQFLWEKLADDVRGDVVGEAHIANEYDARRIARLPDLESAYIREREAAEELARAVKAVLDLNENTSPFGGEMQEDRIESTNDRVHAALTAYRTAVDKSQ